MGAEFLARSLLSPEGNVVLRDYVAVEVGFLVPKGRRPSVAASAGMGDAAVILGRPRQTERFPGDRRPTHDRLPAPPKAPVQEDRSGIEKQPQLAPEEIVTRQALPEGEAAGFVRGMVYFPFKGKIASIQKLDLLYEGPSGAAVLKLRP